jgi:diaminohydroxyphosphoribosylaminopyrimidine deaminase/5-amino-6-(5-phosphoribosylamino)uracil reductase
MSRALELAMRGEFSAHPNPRVGCVIARGGDVVGEGWHEVAGEDHAEIHALRAAGDEARGACAYVTLEPCAHHGKTPPCVEALISADVARVVVAMQDPFPDVGGRGIEALRDAGIRTEVGLMQDEAAALNAGFISRVVRGRPFLRLKIASSLDGATAMDSGESRWITGPAARADVQKLRARSGAVMTGIGTVLADDPSLNVRDDGLDTHGLLPLRVVLDSRLKMPLSATMLTLPGATLVCCTAGHDPAGLRDAGAEVAEFGAHDSHVNVFEVLAALAEREVNDVLVEAGPRLAGYLLEKNLVDELVIYQAPHIMGSNTRRMFETPAWTVLGDRLELDVLEVRDVGGDTRITARPTD